jgi:hypothetical protein
MQAILKISPQKTKITLLPEEIFDTITEFTGDPLHVVWRGVTKPLHEMSKKKFTTITLKDGATNDMLTNILSHYAQFPNITTFNLGLVPTCCKYSKPNGLEQETVMEALGHNKNITTLVDQQGNEKHLHVILNPLAFFKVYPDILLDAKIFTKKEIVNTYGKNITYASLGDQYLSDDLKVDAKTLEKLPNLKSLRVWDNLNKNACDALSNYITINKNLTEIELRDIKFDKDFNITTFITSLTDASKNNKKFE